MKTQPIKQIARDAKPNQPLTRPVVPSGQWLVAAFILAAALLGPVSVSAIGHDMAGTGPALENAAAPGMVESDAGCEAGTRTKSDQVVHFRAAGATAQAILEASSVHVALVDTEVLWMWRAGIGRNSTRYTSQATVIVVDDLDQPVSGARVTGTYTGNYLGESHTISGITEADGSVVLELKKSVTRGVNDPEVTFTFCVDEVQAPLPYAPVDNIVTCDTAP